VGCDVTRLADDLDGASKNSMDAVLMLAIDSINAMIKRGFIVNSLGPTKFLFSSLVMIHGLKHLDKPKKESPRKQHSRGR
jgi:hypothetical protein